jgi:hypothetical protein
MSFLLQNGTLSIMSSDPLSSHYLLTRLAETGTTLQKDLSWQNVSIAFAFILFNALLSWVLEIGVGKSLLISAVRCMVQLTLVATILQQVFTAENKWAVAGISGESPNIVPCLLFLLIQYSFELVLLNLLGTIEVGM